MIMIMIIILAIIIIIINILIIITSHNNNDSNSNSYRNNNINNPKSAHQSKKKLKCRICKNSKNNPIIYYCLVDRVAVHRQPLVGVYRSTRDHTKID